MIAVILNYMQCNEHVDIQLWIEKIIFLNYIIQDGTVSVTIL